ncbi:MAG: hypothetical protein ACLVJB_08830 [Christensenellales bacterium]
MMEEIRAQQVNRARPMTGRDFVLGVASVVLRLALAQILCNLLIAATGAGLLNVLFYLYAVATLAMFMRRTVASSTRRRNACARTQTGRQHDQRGGDSA